MALYIYCRSDGCITRSSDTNGTPIDIPGLTRIKVDGPLEITTHRVVAGQVVPYTPEQQARYDAEPLHEAHWDAGACVWRDLRNATTLAVDARRERDVRLIRSDWTQLPDVPEATQARYQVYRQALRDITSQPGFPTDIQWPEQP
jgi:hypothetical protein